MPIANCLVAQDVWASLDQATDPVALWARYSSQDPRHMTLNLCTVQSQYGHAYAVVARLLVPASWSAQGVASLQSGLSRALENYLCVPASGIIVCTSVLSSGNVFEAGQALTW